VFLVVPFGGVGGVARMLRVFVSVVVLVHD
jgi:hypothetical protein